MRKILPWIAAVVTVSIWAETFISTKVLLNNSMLPPDIFFYRFSLAYILMWFICPRKLFSDNARDEVRFLLMGLFGGSLYFLAENTALSYSTASNVAILVSSAPLLTALVMGAAYKNERMNLRQYIGSFISFGGMVLVVLNGQFILKLNPLGDLLAILAAVVWAFYCLVLRQVTDRYDVRFVTRKVFAYGILTMSLYFVLERPLITDVAILSKPVVWGNLLYLGAVASLLCFLMWNWALKKLGTVRTTNIIYGQSFVTMIFSSVLLGERITMMAIIGSVVLIAGMVLAVKR